MKTINDLRILSAEEIPSETSCSVLWGVFLKPLYQRFYDDLDENKGLMQLDADNYTAFVEALCEELSSENLKLVRKVGYKELTPKEWQKNITQKALSVFIFYFPKFGLFFKHLHLTAPLILAAVEKLMKEPVSAENFIQVKTQIDKLNRLAWVREQTTQEQQSGVSNLGTISETLLERALNELIDERNFFKTGNQEIQSYGDFVLMCLPNNLWLSVKSNFARERLLASGYTTDILGVGFFTDKKEFTSKAKIRNFQRVGFLAMYLPNAPVSAEQIQTGLSTYQEVCETYREQGREMPKNINGTDFLRPLSQLYADINELLTVEDIKNRTTLKF